MSADKQLLFICKAGTEGHKCTCQTPVCCDTTFCPLATYIFVAFIATCVPKALVIKRWDSRQSNNTQIHRLSKPETNLRPMGDHRSQKRNMNTWCDHILSVCSLLPHPTYNALRCPNSFATISAHWVDIFFNEIHTQTAQYFLRGYGNLQVYQHTT